MSRLVVAIRSVCEWWLDGLSRIGEHLTQVYQVPPAADADVESNRANWDNERDRLLLSPWWL